MLREETGAPELKKAREPAWTWAAGVGNAYWVSEAGHTTG